MGRARLCGAWGLPWEESRKLTVREYNALMQELEDQQKAAAMRSHLSSLK